MADSIRYIIQQNARKEEMAREDEIDKILKKKKRKINRGVSARTFYNSISDKSKYKLINGLFIVRYVSNGIYEYVGEFRKKGSVGATPKTSYVKRSPSRQLFNPTKRTITSSLGMWKKLNIGFRMKPISEILK